MLTEIEMDLSSTMQNTVLNPVGPPCTGCQVLSITYQAGLCHLCVLHFSFNVLPTAAIVKTLVMMAGEIEYENFIYENGEALFGVTGHVMIMASDSCYTYDCI